MKFAGAVEGSGPLRPVIPEPAFWILITTYFALVSRCSELNCERVVLLLNEKLQVFDQDVVMVRVFIKQFFFVVSGRPYGVTYLSSWRDP